MRFFRWNSFSVIGLILIAIGLYGLIRGASFQFDAGLPSEPFEGFYYILVGVLMIVNGCIAPKPIPEAAATQTGPAEAASTPGPAAAPTVRSE